VDDHDDNNNDFLLAFQEYLSKTYSRNTAGIRLFYAKKLYHVLLEDNNTMQRDFLIIESGEKRLNVMKSLTALSKYLGCYDRWQEMRRCYNMKWSKGDFSIQSFEQFFNDGLNYDTLLQRIRQMIQKLPVFMSNIVRFACLTGLRPTEVIESVKLINDKEAF